MGILNTAFAAVAIQAPQPDTTEQDLNVGAAAAGITSLKQDRKFV